MKNRLRRRTWAALAERVLLDVDLWIAARLNTKPLADVAIGFAAWAGRVWRHSYDSAHHSLYGPGRGLLAVITTTTKEKTDA